MKICKYCKYIDAHRYNAGMDTVWICNHPECVDPIEGERILCETARSTNKFCGFEAQYYEEKEESKDTEGSDTIITS